MTLFIGIRSRPCSHWVTRKEGGDGKSRIMFANVSRMNACARDSAVGDKVLLKSETWALWEIETWTSPWKVVQFAGVKSWLDNAR